MTVYVPVVLPHQEQLEILSVQFNASVHCLDVHAQLNSQFAVCPVCHQPSYSLHRRYRRTIVDLPTGTFPVRIVLQSQIWNCKNSHCPKKRFAEQVPGLMQGYARRTPRLRSRLAHLGIEAGGEGTARLSVEMGIPWSADTVLREIRALPEIPRPVPCILGVDDWSFRKGRRYGTIWYDVEHHSPFDIMKDRSSESVQTWLKGHSASPRVVTRDSSMTYADGLTRGSPKTIQVADRFHILQNFVEALRRCITRLDAQFPWTESPLSVNEVHENVEESLSSPWIVPPVQISLSPAAKRRQKLWEIVHELVRQGKNYSQIGRELNLSRTTLRSYARMSVPPNQGRQGTHRKIAPFLSYLKQRWEAGSQNVKQLLEEIRPMGYRGSYSILAEVLSKWRDKTPEEIRTLPTLTVFEWTRRWIKGKENLGPEDQQQVTQWLERDSSVAQAYSLTQEFLKAIHRHEPARLQQWLAEAEQGAVPEFRSVARGLRRDEAAVMEALQWPYSNGPTEAAVNSLKTVKRQMFGRGKLDLLRKRYLALGQRRHGYKRTQQPSSELVQVLSEVP